MGKQGTMSGANRFYFKVTDFINGFDHKLGVWLHDHIKVILKSLIKVAHLIIVHFGVTIMRPERIAGKQAPCLQSNKCMLYQANADW